MQSRMNKYHNGDNPEEYVGTTRSSKNKELYKEVGNLEIENYDSNNNYSVVGTVNKEIDVDQIKDMLDKRYKEEPKKKSIGDATQIDLPEIKLDETREYDINVILKNAKEHKEVNYEEERNKKLRNTQYDILKNLNIDGTSSVEEEVEEEKVESDELEETKEQKEERLRKLLEDADNIQSQSEDDTDLALDILSDLKGDEDDTKEIGMMELEEIAKSEKILETKDIPKEMLEETDEFTKTDVIEDEEELEESDDSDDEEESEDKEEEKEKKENNIEDTVDTNSKMFSTDEFKTDEFDDFADLKTKGNIIIKILIFIIIVTILLGVLYFLNNYFNWGLIK